MPSLHTAWQTSYKDPYDGFIIIPIELGSLTSCIKTTNQGFEHCSSGEIDMVQLALVHSSLLFSISTGAGFQPSKALQMMFEASFVVTLDFCQHKRKTFMENMRPKIPSLGGECEGKTIQVAWHGQHPRCIQYHGMIRTTKTPTWRIIPFSI